MIVKDVIELSVKDAVAIRFKELCDQRGIRPNELETNCHSVLYRQLNSVSIGTIKKLCDGLNMSLGEFFSCPLFDDLEQEIQ